MRKVPKTVDVILAHQGFASAENWLYLGRKGLADFIQHKGHYRKALKP